MPVKNQYWNKKNKVLKEKLIQAGIDTKNLPPTPKGVKLIVPDELLSRNVQAKKIMEDQPPGRKGRPPGSKDTMPRKRTVNEVDPDFSDITADEPLPDSKEIPAHDPAAESAPPPGGQKGSKYFPSSQAENVNYRLIAEQYFGLFHNVAANAFQDPAWHPKNDEEKEMVVQPLETYLESQKMDDMPPGMALTVAVLLYSLPRFQSPPTRAKVGKIISKMRGNQAKVTSAAPAGQAQPVAPGTPPADNHDAHFSNVRVL